MVPGRLSKGFVYTSESGNKNPHVWRISVRLDAWTVVGFNSWELNTHTIRGNSVVPRPYLELSLTGI